MGKLVYGDLKDKKAGWFMTMDWPWYYHIGDATVNLRSDDFIVIVTAENQEKIEFAKSELERMAESELIEIKDDQD
ncbi:MAG: hypothetical protein ABIB71_00455 [Candidatus Woesearchaeota archaeon]